MIHDLLQVIGVGILSMLMVLVALAATCLVAYGLLSL